MHSEGQSVLATGPGPPSVSVPLTWALGAGAISLIFKASRQLPHHPLLGAPAFGPVLSTWEEHKPSRLICVRWALAFFLLTSFLVFGHLPRRGLQSLPPFLCLHPHFGPTCVIICICAPVSAPPAEKRLEGRGRVPLTRALGGHRPQGALYAV